MLIKDFITSPEKENTPDSLSAIRLKRQVTEACSIFVNNCKAIQSGSKSTLAFIKESKRFRKEEVTKFNKIYRKDVLRIDSDSRTPAITIGKYVVTLQSIILSQLDLYVDNVKKLDYSRSNLIKVVIDELALLYAKFKKIYDYQLNMVICQVITDYFIIEQVDFTEFKSIMSEILNMDMSAIESIINEFDIREKDKNVKTIKVDDKFPDKEMIESWLAAGFKRSYIKKSLARQLECSEKTIQRLLASYNITDSKYTTKTNLNKQS